QTYFQSYQLAADLARRAERCYRFEIGVQDSGYVQPGAWDNLRSGLLAGERLQLDLRRLEAAYLDQNRRELECTKHVSLALIAPQALLALKDTGTCVVDLPEEIFDLDYPGHYFRRIKSVSLSIPCVAGPQTTIACTLRLLRNRVRINSAVTPQYEHNHDEGVLTDDDRFRESHVRVKSIATSSGQNDSGLFELNFRDERYLPFEGAGAISTWQIELMQDRELRQFPYETIADVILHVRYTAREDAGNFRNEAVQHLRDVLATAGTRMPLRRLFDLPHEFPTEWHAFFHPPAGQPRVLALPLRRDRFPFLAQGGDLQIESVSLFVRTGTTEGLVARLSPPLGDVADDEIALPPTTEDDAFHANRKEVGLLLDETEPWGLRLRKQSAGFDDLTEAEVVEAYLVVEYTLQ
ncbi:MAG TPA: hypothetical protein VJ885_02035, partial [Thermoanaerobaculia bacterium]|nr:hypothetical protein [Thermoanaerobaculia bacterium]